MKELLGTKKKFVESHLILFTVNPLKENKHTRVCFVLNWQIYSIGKINKDELLLTAHAQQRNSSLQFLKPENQVIIIANQT